MPRKVLWTIWALLPIFGLSFHYGPGQELDRRRQAAILIEASVAAQARAEAAQAEAYEKHLAALQARLAHFSANTPDTAAAAGAAGAAEETAYAVAAEAWRAAAEAYGKAQEALPASDVALARRVRVSKASALIRAGQIGTGVQDLQDMLDAAADAGEKEDDVARAAREEMAAGYYYGARLMRLAGKPAQEWRQVSGIARQNFRYLAESSPNQAEAKHLTNNLELVLNLEQSSVEDLQGKAQPRNSPRGNGSGILPGPGRRSPRPPRRGDARNGASGTGEIEGGW